MGELVTWAAVPMWELVAVRSVVVLFDFLLLSGRLLIVVPPLCVRRPIYFPSNHAPAESPGNKTDC